MAEGPVPGSGVGPFVVGGHTLVIPIAIAMGIGVVWQGRQRPAHHGRSERGPHALRLRNLLRRLRTRHQLRVPARPGLRPQRRLHPLTP